MVLESSISSAVVVACIDPFEKSKETEFQLSQIEKATLQGFLVIFWVSALLVWQIFNWHNEAFTAFGKELPAFTELFLRSGWVL